MDDSRYWEREALRMLVVICDFDLNTVRYRLTEPRLIEFSNYPR
jgi:hypothetical protein